MKEFNMNILTCTKSHAFNILPRRFTIYHVHLINYCSDANFMLSVRVVDAIPRWSRAHLFLSFFTESLKLLISFLDHNLTKNLTNNFAMLRAHSIGICLWTSYTYRYLADLPSLHHPARVLMCLVTPSISSMQLLTTSVINRIVIS